MDVLKIINQIMNLKTSLVLILTKGIKLKNFTKCYREEVCFIMAQR